MDPDGSNAVAKEPQTAGSPFVNPERIEMNTAPNSQPEADRPLDKENSSPVQPAGDNPKTEHDKDGLSSKRKEENNLVHFEDRPSFNFALLLAWIIALLSITATLYFWWLNRNLTDVLDDKKGKRTAIVSQLESPGNKEVETEANNFKASVTALSAAKLARTSMVLFLPDFYTKIDNDVKITSLSISSGGAFSIAGTTGSYRAIADQVMALKSWPTLTDVELTASSYSKEAENMKLAAQFSITAKIKPVAPVTAVSSTSSTPSTSSTSSSTTPTPTPSSTTGGTQ